VRVASQVVTLEQFLAGRSYVTAVYGPSLPGSYETPWERRDHGGRKRSNAPWGSSVDDRGDWAISAFRCSCGHVYAYTILCHCYRRDSKAMCVERSAELVRERCKVGYGSPNRIRDPEVVGANLQ
jgi:hypothetical protein